MNPQGFAGREAARRPPRPVSRGDVVTLKCDELRDKYVVVGFLYGPGFRFLVRRAAGLCTQENLVTRCEIATVERSEPVEPDADTYPDGEGAPPTAGSIAWDADDARGEFRSADGRFQVVPVGGDWVATDWHEFQISLPLPLRADAVAWCERQAAGSEARPDPAGAKPVVDWRPFDDTGHQWSGDRRFLVQLWSGTSPGDAPEYEACDFAAETVASRHDTAADARAWCEARAEGRTPPLVDVPGLEWREAEAGGLASACGRFRIVRRLDDLGAPIHGLYLVIDATAEGEELRFSPAAGLDDCKEWSEDRSGFDVVRGVGGEERLSPVVPF